MTIRKKESCIYVIKVLILIFEVGKWHKATNFEVTYFGQEFNFGTLNEITLIFRYFIKYPYIYMHAFGKPKLVKYH